jgi:hypothetical protein
VLNTGVMVTDGGREREGNEETPHSWRNERDRGTAVPYANNPRNGNTARRAASTA